MRLHFEYNLNRRDVLIRCAVLCSSTAVLQLVILILGMKLLFLQVPLLEASAIRATRSTISLTAIAIIFHCYYIGLITSYVRGEIYRCPELSGELKKNIVVR